MAYEQKFAENEATGSRVLTSYGCFQRHKRTRDEQYLTPRESRNAESFSGSRRAEREERRIQNDTARFLKMGFKMNPNMGLEEWIMDIKILIGEV